METNNSPRKARYVFLLSLVTICSALVVFILILVNQFGYFNVTSAKDNPFIKPKVSILLSDYNFTYFGEEKRAFYQEIADQWYNIFKENDIKPKILSDTDITKGKIEADILVLPSTVSLSDDQIKKIKEYTKNGGNLIMSWATGARRETGSWRDYSFIEETTGSKVIQIDEKSIPHATFITVNPKSPVTVGMPAGLRVDLEGDRTEIFARNKNSDSYFSDWLLYPLITEKGYSPYTAITHSNYGKGKVLWFAFNTARMLLKPENKLFLRKIVSNSISWMMGYSVGSIDKWPAGHEVAFFIDQDTEHEHQNAANLAAILKEEKIPATFFCLSGIFEKHQGFLKTLPDFIEIGSHLDTAQNLGNQSYEVQVQRLKKSKDVLEKLTGKKVVGLKPAEEVYDENTIKALIDLDFKYMIGTPNTPAAEPVIISSDTASKDVVKIEQLLLQPLKGEFVLLPRISHDDYYIMVLKKILDKKKINSILRTDFQNIHNLGGLFIFPVHTQLFSKPEKSSVISSLIKYAKKHNVWFATGEQIAEWWVKRNKLSHKISYVDDNSFKATLTSRNRQDLQNVGLTYYLAGEYSNISVTNTSDSEQMKFKFDKSGKTLNVQIPIIKAEGRIDIHVEYK